LAQAPERAARLGKAADGTTERRAGRSPRILEKGHVSRHRGQNRLVTQVEDDERAVQVHLIERGCAQLLPRNPTLILCISINLNLARLLLAVHLDSRQTKSAELINPPVSGSERRNADGNVEK
jgi:hypothetical protein